MVTDNCSIHETSEVMKFFSHKLFKVLFIPPYIPEFNGIEIYWSILMLRPSDIGLINITIKIIEYS